MGKLCARGKAAAKAKFKVYPSAYANMYASAVCSGKVTPGGKKKPKKKAMGGSISQQRKSVSANRMAKGGSIVAAGCGMVDESRRKKTKLFVQEVIMEKIWNKWSFLLGKKWNNLNKKGKLIVVVVVAVIAWAVYNQVV